jgi:hypothetical protein
MAAINAAMTSDHAVAGIDLFVETEVARAMHDQLVKLFKRPFIEQKLNPFTRGHLSRRVLFLDTGFAAALLSAGAALTQCLES